MTHAIVSEPARADVDLCAQMSIRRTLMSTRRAQMRIAARVQMNVPDRPRHMTRIATNALRLGKRLPLERSAVVGSPASRACAKRRQDLREDAQRARALDVRDRRCRDE